MAKYCAGSPTRCHWPGYETYVSVAWGQVAWSGLAVDCLAQTSVKYAVTAALALTMPASVNVGRYATVWSPARKASTAKVCCASKGVASKTILCWRGRSAIVDLTAASASDLPSTETPAAPLGSVTVTTAGAKTTRQIG